MDWNINNQEIFDKVVRGILSQGGPSASACDEFTKIRCKYRSTNGRKCAAGHLISDEDYDPEMEDLGSIRNNHYVKNYLFNQHIDCGFAAILQTIHDETFRNHPNNDENFIRVWSEEMKILADNLGLSIKVFDNV
jgi:hypothetical protein